MSGNCSSSRSEILFLILTTMPADTQSQVRPPPDVVLLQQAFTHRSCFFVGVTKRGRNAQYVMHITTAFRVDTLNYYSDTFSSRVLA